MEGPIVMRRSLLGMAFTCASVPALAQTTGAAPLSSNLGAYIGLAGLAVAVVCLLVALYVTRQLRRLVRERTAELEAKNTDLAAEIEGRRTVEASQARLAAIVEATSDFVAVAEPSGTLLYINRAGRALVGVPPESEASTVTVQEMTTAEEYEKLLNERLPIVEQKGGWSGQTILVSRKGREIPVLQVIVAHRDAEGELRQISTIARDITALKRAELTLRERERQLMTLMQNLPGMAYRCMNDPLWTMKFVSEGARELTGYTPDELVNNQVIAYSELIHPDDRGNVWDAVQAALEDHRPYQILYRIHARDGGERWVWEHGRGVFTRRSGRLVALEGFIADITQRRSAELAAGQMREYLQNLIDSMPSTLVGVDMQGRITHWNEEAERLTGWAAPAALGAVATELIPILSGDLPKIQTAIENQLPSKTTRTAYNGAAAGRTFDIMIYPLTARGVNGAVIRLDDVTQRARIEAMMAQTEKMMLVGGLAAGMAHEINNPLGGILQACANILRRTSAERRDNQDAAAGVGAEMALVHAYLEERGVFEFVASIQEACQRASTIVADMLAFSRSGDTRMAETRVPDLLESVARLAANDMDMRLPQGGRIALELEVPADIGTVQCDSSKIQQVLLNLVRNALQAIKEQAGDIAPRIILRARREPAHLVLEVEDNGPGMDLDTQRRAFEPFFTTKEVGVGTGLGLSVSYFLIVDQHKGTIDVESQPGQGARFVIRLPVTAY